MRMNPNRNLKRQGIYALALVLAVLCVAVAVPVVRAATAAPVITQQPVHHHGKVGTTATFTVEADTTSPSYQWQVSTDYGKTWKNYTGTGAKTNQISIKVTKDNMESVYRCKVKDTISGKSTTSAEAMIRTAVVASDEFVSKEGHAMQWELTMNGTIFFSGEGTIRAYYDLNEVNLTHYWENTCYTWAEYLNIVPAAKFL